MGNLKKMQTRAQISRAAIQRLYISMRHLFVRGHYKPLGVSGEAMIEAMMKLKPEIYGSIADPERVELKGLLYIFQRLPQGIEECRYVKLIGREGFENSDFKPIIPSKRRRHCYRIDKEQMYIEMTRGRSDIYDILTHLTFMYIEAEKIRTNSFDTKNRPRREWVMLQEMVEQMEAGEEINLEVGYTYLSTVLGRTYEETIAADKNFSNSWGVNSLFRIAYWLGKRSVEEFKEKNDRQISFSSALRERLGSHIYGEQWATKIKRFLEEKNLIAHPIHIISANMHSVMNSIFAKAAIKSDLVSIEEVAENLSKPTSAKLREKVRKFALKNGMYELSDHSGMNISVQIFDSTKVEKYLPEEINWKSKNPFVIIVMDYAFGEQAYESMDELLKPYEKEEERIPLNIESINIMGKAGILTGDKGDIMIPQSHVFEGGGDNYPFENDLTTEEFEGHGIGVYEGSMVTVLGTSLQNKDILRYFLRSSWKGVGLEMEGGHYQKAIQAASKIRHSISKDVKLRYAYYASDNPLETGSTLASGSLGLDGVKPTYLITNRILNRLV